MTLNTFENLAAMCRTSPAAFVAAMHSRTIPDYVHPNYMDFLTTYIGNAIERGGAREVINMPPRHAKTKTLLALIAWCLGRDPTMEIILVTHNDSLARDQAGQLRALLRNDFYRSVFGEIQLEEGRTTMTDFRTTQGGRFLAASIDSGISGQGANLIFLDDTISANNATSRAVRAKAKESFDTMISTRLNRPGRGGIISISHRVNEDDTSGHLLKMGYNHLCLRARAEEDEHYSIEGATYSRKKGEFLLPEVFGPKEAEEREKFPTTFQTHYQQRTVALTGGIIKPGHFPLASACPSGGQAVFSLDTAWSLGETASYSVGLLFQVFDDVAYLRRIVRGRMDMELQRVVTEIHATYRPLHLVEATGVGNALIKQLMHDGCNVIPATPTGSKEDRILSVLNKLEANFIRPVAGIAGLDEFINECCAFPEGEYDDHVDALSQFLQWHSSRNAGIRTDLAIRRVDRPFRYNSRAGTIARVLKMTR